MAEQSQFFDQDAIAFEAHAGVHIYTLPDGSELDPPNSTTLRDRLLHTFNERSATSLVLDLSGVEYMDSTALGVLVGSLKKCREREINLVIDIAGVNSNNLGKIFRVTGLERVFNIQLGRSQEP